MKMVIDLSTINFGGSGGGSDTRVEPRTEYTITTNGSYPINPDSEYDAMEGVDVIVSVPQTKNQTQREVTISTSSSTSTIISPSAGYDAMESVRLTVDVPTKIQDMKIVNQEVNTSGLYVFQPDDGYDAMKVVRANLTIPSTPVQTIDLDTGIRFSYSNFETFPYVLTGGAKLTDLNQLFFYCSNLKSVNLSLLEFPQVTSMKYIFTSCNNLTTLDLSNFNISSEAYVLYMFDLCTSLTTVKVINCNDVTKNIILGQLRQSLNSYTWTLGDDDIIRRSKTKS